MSSYTTSGDTTLYLPDSKVGPRTIWLCEAARGVLDRLPRSSGFVFPVAGLLNPWQWLDHFWHGVREEAGLGDAAGPYAFPSPRHPDKPLSGSLCLWRRARKEAGLDDGRLHDLRHTVASQAVARGVPLSTVARMLGHADPVMTLRYAHVGDRDLQAAAERIGKAIEAAMETGESPAEVSS